MRMISVIYTQQVQTGRFEKTQSSFFTSPCFLFCLNLKLRSIQDIILGDKWRPESGFENLVFTGSFGRCISETALYEDMKKIRTQIREDGHVFGEYTPHSLRHTFATRGFEKGIPPKVMQEILGHKSITMTLDIYSHVLPDKKAEEINKLAATF